MIEPFLPMLAVAGEPFDSPEHLFEVKWDGVRCLAASHADGVRLWGRELADYSARYPELAVLGRLPHGTVIDGELVMLRAGRADLSALLGRHQLTGRWKIDVAARRRPVTYMAFDLLHHGGRRLFDWPLHQRRALLAELAGQLQEPRLAFSEGVAGSGRALLQSVIRQGHEGVMAKRLDGRYQPGRRAAGWRKIKPRRSLLAVIIGCQLAGGVVHSLLAAAQREGQLRYVARLTSGLSGRERVELASRLVPLTRSEPVVPCPRRARWVEPELFCQVKYLRWSPRGRLLGASFLRLVEAPRAEPDKRPPAPGRRTS